MAQVTGAQARMLPCGTRLHLHHGPIDLIISAEGAQQVAFAAARARFDTVLEELARELPLLRDPMHRDAARPVGAVAQRMDSAVRPFCDVFVTRMAAVAGSVADEVLAAMRTAAPLSRAYVNNGGDIALYLGPGPRFTTAMRGHDGTDLGRISLDAGSGVGGIATSGRHGRSLSLGVADAVTVLAKSAAEADAAATLIANAVDLPGHAAVARRPACDLDPDSDLGARLVVTGCGPLSSCDVARALDAGAARTRVLRAAGRIIAAAVCLQGEITLIGPHFTPSKRSLTHA